ncbi:MAG: alpha-E domain-containing protein [Actinomycetales bacterium]
MLSRIAESLFWIGRYVERADGTARIVDVLRLQQMEEASQSESISARLVLSDVMGLPTPQGPLTFDDVANRLVFDTSRQSSISGTWWAARENARRARETLSTELWECINTSWHRWRDLGSYSVTSTHLDWVRERAALVAGIADATMSHDEALNFLLLGRLLERADMTARLVATGSLPGNDESTWISVLQSCGAAQAYLRTNRGVVEDERAAAFLVLDRLFPRSIVYSLTEAERRLLALDPEVDRIGFSDEARRRLGRIRTSLEYRAIADVIPDLPAQMLRVQQTVIAASDAVARRYFKAGPVQTWTEELA